MPSNQAFPPLELSGQVACFCHSGEKMPLRSDDYRADMHKMQHMQTPRPSQCPCTVPMTSESKAGTSKLFAVQKNG